MMMSAKPFIERGIHPTVVVNAFYKAMTESLNILKDLAIPIDAESDEDIKKALKCCIGTKFT